MKYKTDCYVQKLLYDLSCDRFKMTFKKSLMFSIFDMNS